MKQGMRDRETDRERQTDRETDRQRDRQRQTDRERERAQALSTKLLNHAFQLYIVIHDENQELQKRWLYFNERTGNYFFCHRWLLCCDTKMLKIELNVHLPAQILLQVCVRYGTCVPVFTKSLLFILAVRPPMT